jgi:hypothetical protein
LAFSVEFQRGQRAFSNACINDAAAISAPVNDAKTSIDREPADCQPPKWRTKMRKSSITKVIIVAVALTGGVGVSSQSTLAYNVSSVTSSPGSNNTYNPLAPTTTGEVGMSDTRMPVIPADQQHVNCHLLTGYSKGSGCR